MTIKKMSDTIEEYFIQSEGSKQAIHSRELFDATNDNIDLKTHLRDDEIMYINTLHFNNEILKSRGLKPVFLPFITKYMRLKISKDRLSRGEFVKINTMGNNPEQMLNTMSNLKNITDVKK